MGVEVAVGVGVDGGFGFCVGEELGLGEGVGVLVGLGVAEGVRDGATLTTGDVFGDTGADVDGAGDGIGMASWGFPLRATQAPTEITTSDIPMRAFLGMEVSFSVACGVIHRCQYRARDPILQL